MTDLVVVLTTVPTADVGERLARALVEERLAACVNMLPPMRSTYRWKGSVETETEQQLVIKTSQSLVPRLSARLSALHPYELPELIVLEAGHASDAYLAWVGESTS